MHVRALRGIGVVRGRFFYDLHFKTHGDSFGRKAGGIIAGLVTEDAVHHAMADLLTGRTALVIAHRLSTLRLVDEVAVLEHGRIVERGRPEVLVAEGGPYARLAHLARAGRQDVLP